MKRLARWTWLGAAVCGAAWLALGCGSSANEDPAEDDSVGGGSGNAALADAGVEEDDEESASGGAGAADSEGTGATTAAASGASGESAGGSSSAGGSGGGSLTGGTGGNSTGGMGGSSTGGAGVYTAAGGSSASGGSSGYTPLGGAGGAMTGGTGGSTGGMGGGAMAGAAGASASEGEAGASNEGDRYEPVGTNPFTLTAYDPLSTFAADVDTASYDIFRRDIQNGLLPQPASVRLEEYVNYFRYGYPKPDYDSEVPFGISLAAAPNVLDRETNLLRIGIQGKAAPPREGANLVFLVDVSGSMSSSDKLPLVQFVLTEALDVLDPDDTVSIVTYASNTGVRLGPTPVDDRGVIEAAINGLTAGGSTAGEAGINLAYDQAQAGFIEGGVNHVLLCTDGDFNVGQSSDEALVQLIEQQRQTGVTLGVLGFGSGNLNDSMMEAITNAGNGTYSVISDATQAERYVEDRLLSSMVYIAKDMKIQVEFNPEFVYAYRLLGYENRAIADQQFRDDTVDAGEVGANHQVTAIYELVETGHEIPLPEGAPEPEDGEPYTEAVEIAASDFVLVKVRYKDVDATEEDPAYEVSLSLTPDDVSDTYTDLDADFQWAVAVATFAEVLKQSPYGDAAYLPQVANIIGASAHESYPERVEFVELFGAARQLLQP